MENLHTKTLYDPELTIIWYAIYNLHMHIPVYTPDPLFQYTSYPEVTFLEEPQEKNFPSSGGHVDFENGLEITIPSCADQLESSTSVKVQPSFAPSDVFVLPQDIQSASPSYLVTGRGPGLTGEVTLTMEHHVHVKTEEDANDLLFLHANATPTTSDSKSVYKYKEVPEARAEFQLKENKGKLTTRLSSNKFFRVGFRKRFRKLFCSKFVIQTCHNKWVDLIRNDSNIACNNKDVGNFEM